MTRVFSPFPTSVPLQLVESGCHKAHITPIIQRVRNFNVWHRRTPQMYIVVESDPSGKGTDAHEDIILVIGCFKTAQLLGPTHHCSRKRRVDRVHQDLHSMCSAYFLQARVMYVRCECFLDRYQTQI